MQTFDATSNHLSAAVGPQKEEKKQFAKKPKKTLRKSINKTRGNLWQAAAENKREAQTKSKPKYKQQQTERLKANITATTTTIKIYCYPQNQVKQSAIKRAAEKENHLEKTLNTICSIFTDFNNVH